MNLVFNNKNSATSLPLEPGMRENTKSHQPKGNLAIWKIREVLHNHRVPVVEKTERNYARDTCKLLGEVSGSFIKTWIKKDILRCQDLGLSKAISR